MKMSESYKCKVEKVLTVDIGDNMQKDKLQTISFFWSL